MKLHRARRVCFGMLGVLCVAAGCKKQDHGETAGNVVEKKAAEAPPIKAACSFEWVDLAKPSPELAEVSQAFEQELRPDPPASDPGVSTYPLKRIVRLARCGDATLVVLEKSSAERKRKEWDRPFELYDFNLTTKQKTAITASWIFWLLQFDALPHFEDSDVPDITFRSMSCTECEPVTMLSSVRFDPGLQKWELRKWPKDEDGVTLFDSSVGVDGSSDEYETIYGIADFDGKGYDEVALWTHYREWNEKDKPPAPVTTLSLYSFAGGVAVETEIKDEDEMVRLKTRLCQMDPKKAACKKSSAHGKSASGRR
jgi:hypothetical protein